MCIEPNFTQNQTTISIYLHKFIEYILIILLYRKEQKKTISSPIKGLEMVFSHYNNPILGNKDNVYVLLLLFKHPIDIVNNKRISHYVKYRQEWHHFR